MTRRRWLDYRRLSHSPAEPEFAMDVESLVASQPLAIQQLVYLLAQDFTERECAQLLGCSRGAIRYRLRLLEKRLECLHQASPKGGEPAWQPAVAS